MIKKRFLVLSFLLEFSAKELYLEPVHLAIPLPVTTTLLPQTATKATASPATTTTMMATSTPVIISTPSPMMSLAAGSITDCLATLSTTGTTWPRVLSSPESSIGRSDRLYDCKYTQNVQVLWEKAKLHGRHELWGGG